MKKFKDFLVEGYGEALPLWLKAIVKVFPEMKMQEEDTDYIVTWKGKAIVGASFEGGKIVMQRISTKTIDKAFDKMNKKGFKKEEDVRAFIYKAIEPFQS